MNEENKHINLSKGELLTEEKKLKRNSKIATIVYVLAVANVFLGICLHQNRGVFTVFLILGALFFLVKYSNELKKIQTEIKSRKEL